MANCAETTEKTEVCTNKSVNKYNDELKLVRAVLKEFREGAAFYSGSATHFDIRHKENGKIVRTPAVYVYQPRNDYTPTIFMTIDGELVHCNYPPYSNKAVLHRISLIEASNDNMPEIVGEHESSITGLLIEIVRTCNQKMITLSTPNLEQYQNVKDNEIERFGLMFTERAY